MTKTATDLASNLFDYLDVFMHNVQNAFIVHTSVTQRSTQYGPMKMQTSTDEHRDQWAAVEMCLP